MKIDVNVLDKDEKSEEISQEKEVSEVIESSEDESAEPEVTGEEPKASKKETEEMKEKEEDSSGEKRKKSGKKGGNGGGNGNKSTVKRNIFLFIIFLFLLIVIILTWKPEFVPGFFKLTEDTVLVVEELEDVPETTEFSITPVDDEEASDTLERIRKAIDSSEHVVPENLLNLKQQISESRERLKRFFILSRHFPNGLFWSYYSASSGFELFEMKANKPGRFEAFFNRVMEENLYKELKFYSYDGKYWDSLEGVFAGRYKLSEPQGEKTLYNLDSEAFLDYVGHAAQKAGVNFTDLSSYKVETTISGTRQNAFKLTFYGTVNQLSVFSDAFLEIPATFTINKVIAGRRPSDSYPDPLKLTLFVSLFEKD
jgi:hypothetical protein